MCVGQAENKKIHKVQQLDEKRILAVTFEICKKRPKKYSALAEANV